jgi:8-oxo-dGTP diphosphatase
MMTYSFCPKCGQALHCRPIDGVERLACSSCGFIFYQNSKPCVGVLAVKEGQLLLVRRAIEPYFGYWDIPGGFLEAGEHPEAGAIREMVEETGLVIEPVEILGLYMSTYGPAGEPTLNICYLAEVAGGQPRPASDASDLRWFDLDDLPEQIAFDWSHEALARLRQRYK